jgi:lipopolysaccharide export LptBFGC system permease protein LptF
MGAVFANAPIEAGRLGRSGLLPAAIAAWIPNFMFAMIAVSIFLFGEER